MPNVKDSPDFPFSKEDFDKWFPSAREKIRVSVHRESLEKEPWLWFNSTDDIRTAIGEVWDGTRPNPDLQTDTVKDDTSEAPLAAAQSLNMAVLTYLASWIVAYAPETLLPRQGAATVAKYPIYKGGKDKPDDGNNGNKTN